MTAAALGLAGDYIATTQKPLQFDMDPLDAGDQTKADLFNRTVPKIDAAVAAYLAKKNLAPSHVHAGLSPGYWQGAMIMGVYILAGQETPQPAHPGVIASPLAAPILSVKGKALWDKIRTVSPSTPQYTGRGAYTGFVDNKNTVGDTDPVGPRSTARMVAPAPRVEAPTSVPYSRWLPPDGHPLWNARKRKGTDTYVPWGLIGGDKATQDPTPTNETPATNLADQIELEMRDKYGMVFTTEPTMADIATYTHGMIQAIYKAYALGPSCEPYEIAVGDQTKKMASCLPCILFMHTDWLPADLDSPWQRRILGSAVRAVQPERAHRAERARGRPRSQQRVVRQVSRVADDGARDPRRCTYHGRPQREPRCGGGLPEGSRYRADHRRRSDPRRRHGPRLGGESPQPHTAVA